VIAGFDIEPIICPEDPLVIENTSTGAINTWKWSFGNIGVSSLENPVPVQFPMTNVETTYNIKLICTNNLLGCSDSITKKVKVLNNCFIAVPTAFTPNNDGLNDFLYPNNAIKAKDMDFRVYNRWGQLVFHSRDWTKKWDGKIGGLLQASGVFVWMLEYTHIVTGEKRFQKGTTTLIR
jgi:gliding motility-associated-like protein